MKIIETFAKKRPIAAVIGITLYAAIVSALPFALGVKFTGATLSKAYFSGFALKTLSSALPFFLIFACGLKGVFGLNGGAKRLLLCLPALIIAINNFPILPLLTDDMGLDIYVGDILPYILYCLAVAVMEEVIFRGLILPLLAHKFGGGKKGLAIAVLLSSALFGAMHLINLLGGADGEVFIQVGYSFLIGALFGACMLFTGKIFVPIIFHFIFDFGGLLFPSFGYGTLWTAGNIVLTAIISALAALFIIIIFIRADLSASCQPWGQIRGANK